jgi:hypothetical protein
MVKCTTFIDRTLMAFRLPARSWKLSIQTACVIAYVFSLTLPALLFDGPYPRDQSGLEVLGKGIMGLIVLDPRWLANLCFVWCVAVNAADGRGRKLPVLGLLLVAASVFLPIHYFPQDHGIRVDALGPGAWIWAGSLAVTFALTLLGNRSAVPVSAAGRRIPGPLGAALLVVAAIASFFLLQDRLFPARARLAELCKQAEVRFDFSVNAVSGVYLEDDRFAQEDGREVSLGEGLIYYSSIQFVERKVRRFPGETSEVFYERLWGQPGPGRDNHPGALNLYIESIPAPTAAYVVRSTNLSEHAVTEGLGGSRIDVFETRDGMHRVAHAQRYWNRLSGQACPVPEQSKSADLEFIIQALGLHRVPNRNTAG